MFPRLLASGYSQEKMGNRQQHDSPWPHRVAVVLVCATFPLIWIGGLVTSTDAGMAVPDYPSTFGYNLFLYPWQTWLLGPWDIFIEHGHRLLGALVGLITIALVAVVWKFEPRTWVRWLSVGTLVAVIAQGLLGGARVIQDDVQLAKIHGCLGPAFFALCVAMAVVTSHYWRAREQFGYRHDGAGKLHRLSLLTAGLVYLQIIIGAHLRHLPADWDPGVFRAVVFFHLIMAAAILIHVVLLLAKVTRNYRGVAGLMGPAVLTAVLIGVQLFLGGASWVVKYSWPSFMSGFDFAAGYTVQAQGYWQAMLVTAHQATGSLLLAAAVLLAMRGLRLVHPKQARAPARTLVEVPA